MQPDLFAEGGRLTLRRRLRRATSRKLPIFPNANRSARSVTYGARSCEGRWRVLEDPDAVAPRTAYLRSLLARSLGVGAPRGRKGDRSSKNDRRPRAVRGSVLLGTQGVAGRAHLTLYNSPGTSSYGSRSRSRSRRVVLKPSGVVFRMWVRVVSTLCANILRSNFARKRTGSRLSRASNTHLA